MHCRIKGMLGIVLCLSIQAKAQYLTSDTLHTFFLSEVVVQSKFQDADTLQNFFRANKSATTEDILSRLQGVYLIRRGNYGQEPMLRGMTGGQISMTIDGMKMFGACTDKMDPVSIYVEPQNLSSIDAQVGSDGVRLGSTVGGGIDMKLTQPMLSPKKIFGKMGAGYQSAWRGFNGYANANFSESKSAYNLSLNYRLADDYRAGGGEVVPYSQYEKMNVSVGGKWAIQKDTLLAQVLLDDGWNIGYPSLPMDVGFAKARVYSLSFLRGRCHQLLEKLNTKLYFNTVEHSMDDTHRTDVVMHMDMPGYSTTWGGFTEGNFLPLKKHRLSFRADFFNNQVLAEMTMYPAGEASMYMQTWPTSGRSVAGFFVNDFYTVSKTTKVTFNTRVDISMTHLEEGIGKQQLEVFYPAVPSYTTMALKNFNVKINQLLGSNFIADFHAGYGERLPTLSETFGFYLFNRSDGFDYIGNPYLMEERSWTSDLSLSYYRNRIQFNATGFYNYLPDYIFSSIQSDLSPMTPGANGVKLYQNIAYAVMMGSEVSVLASLFDQLQFISTLKYVKAAADGGQPLPLIPPLSATTSLRFRRFKYNFQVENETSMAQSRINLSYGEDATPAYSILNVRAGYASNWKGKMIIVNAGVENVFDKNYHNHLDWGNIPRPGRNVNLSVEVKF